MTEGSCQKESAYTQEVNSLKYAIYDNFRKAGLGISTVANEYSDYVSGKFDMIAYLDITSIYHVDAGKLFAGIKLVMSWSKKRVKKALERKNFIGCATQVLSVGIGSDGNQSTKYITVRFSGTTNVSKT
jgi:hypothetical protein